MFWFDDIMHMYIYILRVMHDHCGTAIICNSVQSADTNEWRVCIGLFTYVHYQHAAEMSWHLEAVQVPGLLGQS